MSPGNLRRYAARTRGDAAGRSFATASRHGLRSGLALSRAAVKFGSPAACSRAPP